MCKLSKNQQHGLERFCKQVEEMSWQGRPDYQKLKSMLKGLIQYEKQKEFNDPDTSEWEI